MRGAAVSPLRRVRTGARHAVEQVNDWNRRRDPAVKVYGLLRAGTNYLSALLQTNYRVRALDSEEGGWKHGPLNAQDGVTPVVITKSPFTWLVSFYDWEVLSNRTNASLEEFIGSPVTHPKLLATWHATDPLDAWNRITRYWLEASEHHGLALVRYEDLLTDFDSELQRLEGQYVWRRRHRSLVDITERVDTWPTPRPRKLLDRTLYLTGASARIDGPLLQLITTRLDRDALVSLRYADGP